MEKHGFALTGRHGQKPIFERGAIQNHPTAVKSVISLINGRGFYSAQNTTVH